MKIASRLPKHDLVSLNLYKAIEESITLLSGKSMCFLGVCAEYNHSGLHKALDTSIE